MVKNKSSVQETQIWSLGWEDPLEEGMAIHSSILAWRIPWTEETGGLQSMGLRRVGHDWAINTHFQFCQLSKGDHPHQVLGIIQSAEGLNRTKRWRNGKFALSAWTESHLLLPSDIGAPDSWAHGLWPELTPPALKVFRLTEYTTVFPGSLAHRWQTMEFLDLQKHVSQLLH